MQCNGPIVVSCLNVMVLNTYSNTNRNKTRLVILIAKSHMLLNREPIFSNSDTRL